MKPRITRIRKEGDYHAIFSRGVTLRLASPQRKMEFPELEDWGINTLCRANCPYCYTSATSSGVNFDNIVDKLHILYKDLDAEKRPFQVAIGGSGEPTLHPDFPEFVKSILEYKIIPNVTTNGMHLSETILRAMEAYCGGVAVSYHPHIEAVFGKALEKLSNVNIILNVHYILGTPGSFEHYLVLREKFGHLGHRWAILPYQGIGRASDIDVLPEYFKFFKYLEECNQHDELRDREVECLAFGAGFYQFFKTFSPKIPVSLYEPEMVSGYRLFDQTFQKLRNSSYDPTFSNPGSGNC